MTIDKEVHEQALEEQAADLVEALRECVDVLEYWHHDLSVLEETNFEIARHVILNKKIVKEVTG